MGRPAPAARVRARPSPAGAGRAVGRFQSLPHRDGGRRGDHDEHGSGFRTRQRRMPSEEHRPSSSIGDQRLPGGDHRPEAIDGAYRPDARTDDASSRRGPSARVGALGVPRSGRRGLDPDGRSGLTEERRCFHGGDQLEAGLDRRPLRRRRVDHMELRDRGSALPPDSPATSRSRRGSTPTACCLWAGRWTCGAARSWRRWSRVGSTATPDGAPRVADRVQQRFEIFGGAAQRERGLPQGVNCGSGEIAVLAHDPPHVAKSCQRNAEHDSRARH